MAMGGEKIELSDIKKKKQFKYTEKFEIQTKSIVNEKGEINSVKPDAQKTIKKKKKKKINTKIRKIFWPNQINEKKQKKSRRYKYVRLIKKEQ